MRISIIDLNPAECACSTEYFKSEAALFKFIRSYLDRNDLDYSWGRESTNLWVLYY